MNTNSTRSVARYQSVQTQQSHVQQRRAQIPVVSFSQNPLVEKLYQDIEKLKQLHKK
jgi:hypothetical protein